MMKKAFTLTVRSKEGEASDASLKKGIKEVVSGLGEDYRVTVNRAKDLDPAK